MGSVFSAIGHGKLAIFVPKFLNHSLHPAGINAIISAIAGIIMTIVSVITDVRFP
jgi:hypothetical protein